MADTTFVSGTTIASPWLNDVNRKTYQENISIGDFGAIGDGATDNTAAFAAAQAFCATLSAAGNAVKLHFPAGRYLYSASPNWAINRLHLDFDGEVWLINTGTGSSFILDGGASGTGVYGMKITGFPLVYGSASTGHGYYLRAIHRSSLQLNCRGAGTTFSGLYMEWCVSDTIEYIMNFNEGGLYATPARGMTLTLRGSAEETSYCTFINPELSGLPLGAYFDGALGNIFIGGAVQGNVNGIDLTANAWNNKFIGTDFEVNSGYDTSCGARETQYIGCDFEKKPIFTTGAVNNSVVGGVCESIQVDSGALRTVFTGVVYNRFGSGSITDNGTGTRFRDMRNKGTGIIEDVARARTALTVTASPYTYTNTSGNDQTIIVSGGTVSQIVLTRFAGDPVGITSGQFLLKPNDAISVTYSSAPSVVRWT